MKMADVRKKLATLIAAFGVLIVVAGCGVSSDSAPENSGVSGPEASFEEADQGGTPQQAAQATPRTEGNIRIAGKAQGSLTESLIRAYDFIF